MGVLAEAPDGHQQKWDGYTWQDITPKARRHVPAESETIIMYDSAALQEVRLLLEPLGLRPSHYAQGLVIRVTKKFGELFSAFLKSVPSHIKVELEGELANFEHQTLRSVTAEQKRQILQLGRDFPRLWGAPTTAASDRKRMLRLLIRDITVVKGPEPKRLRIQIRWQGGAIETLETRTPPNRAEELRYPDAFVDKIRALADRHDDEEIVALLNCDRLKSSTGKPFTVSIIRWIRYKHRIPSPSLPAGALSVSQVRERYGVSLWVVHYWIERRIVTAAQRKPNAPYAITIDDDEDRRLRKWVANSGHLHPSSPRQTA